MFSLTSSKAENKPDPDQSSRSTVVEWKGKQHTVVGVDESN